MKILFALTAAALAASALTAPASAATIGCDPGNDHASAKATDCHNWASSTKRHRASGAYAYVPSSRMAVAPRGRVTPYLPDLENEGGRTGVSGGAAN